MASTQDQSQNVCGICLASAASRGGVPLCCPGCCGKWFHQNCFDDLVKSGIQECPMCRTTFPNLVGAGAPPAPPVLQQQQQILLSAPLQQQQQQQLPQQAQQQAGIFNRLSSYFSTASISNSNVPTQNRNVVHQQQLQYSSNVYSPRFGGSPNSSAVPAMSAEEDKLSTEQIAANNSSTGGECHGDDECDDECCERVEVVKDNSSLGRVVGKGLRYTNSLSSYEVIGSGSVLKNGGARGKRRYVKGGSKRLVASSYSLRSSRHPSTSPSLLAAEVTPPHPSSDPPAAYTTPVDSLPPLSRKRTLCYDMAELCIDEGSPYYVSFFDFEYSDCSEVQLFKSCRYGADLGSYCSGGAAEKRQRGGEEGGEEGGEKYSVQSGSELTQTSLKTDFSVPPTLYYHPVDADEFLADNIFAAFEQQQSEEQNVEVGEEGENIMSKRIINRGNCETTMVMSVEEEKEGDSGSVSDDRESDITSIGPVDLPALPTSSSLVLPPRPASYDRNLSSASVVSEVTMWGGDDEIEGEGEADVKYDAIRDGNTGNELVYPFSSASFLSCSSKPVLATTTDIVSTENIVNPSTANPSHSAATTIVCHLILPSHLPLALAGNTTSTTSNTTAAAATPRLTVSTTPEFPHTSLAVNNAFYARFSLKYEESAAAAGRKVPLDVVCVLDNSGSMSGSKIESLKKAMQFVMDTLGPDDRLAVVNFNSYATTLHGLLKMNPSNRTQAKDQIRALYATGGTDIYAGMKSGWDLLAQRQTKNPASCMFLLTDGQDTSNLREKLELAKQMKAAGTSLFVFGFGSDHDSEHMNAIANGAEGVFSYVESDDMVTDAFGGTIGTQQGLSLSNIQLTLDCAERDVKVVQLMTGYRHTLASTGRSGTVHFVNMFLGEQRDIIVKLSLPAVDSAVDDYELLRGSATFQITGSTTTYNAENVGICTVHRLPDNKLPVGTVRDLEVDIQLNRLDCTAAINAALSEADKSNFGAARDQLESAKIKLQTSVSYQHALTLSGGASSSSTTLPGNLNTVLALMQEIEDALQRVQSRSAYDNGGRAMMQEASNQNTYQRTTYNKAGRVNKYQSPASMQMQSCAFASKGSY